MACVNTLTAAEMRTLGKDARDVVFPGKLPGERAVDYGRRCHAIVQAALKAKAEREGRELEIEERLDDGSRRLDVHTVIGWGDIKTTEGDRSPFEIAAEHKDQYAAYGRLTGEPGHQFSIRSDVATSEGLFITLDDEVVSAVVMSLSDYTDVVLQTGDWSGSSSRDFAEAKEEILEDALEDAEPGDQVTAQTEGEIINPHGDDEHTDFTIGTKEDGGSVSFEKGHGRDE